jgi:hypothetical protein
MRLTGTFGLIMPTNRSIKLSFPTKTSRFKELSQRSPKSLDQAPKEICPKYVHFSSEDFAHAALFVLIDMKRLMMKILNK